MLAPTFRLLLLVLFLLRLRRWSSQCLLDGLDGEGPLRLVVGRRGGVTSLGARARAATTDGKLVFVRTLATTGAGSVVKVKSTQ